MFRAEDFLFVLGHLCFSERRGKKIYISISVSAPDPGRLIGSQGEVETVGPQR